jgi:subtilisin family serine protease
MVKAEKEPNMKLPLAKKSFSSLLCAALFIPQLSFAVNVASDKSAPLAEETPVIQNFSFTPDNLNAENLLPSPFDLEKLSGVLEPEMPSVKADLKARIIEPIFQAAKALPVARQSRAPFQLQNQQKQKFSFVSTIQSLFKKFRAKDLVSAKSPSVGALFDGENLAVSALNPVSQDESERAALTLLLKTAVNAGTDLESWGLPNSIAVQGRYLRYAKLYRMSGQATDLGIALHEILKPLVDADPHFLSRISQSQLNEAVSLAEFSTHYSLNPAAPGLYARHRLLRKNVSTGHDYPEWRSALVLRAQKILSTPAAKGDRPARLIPVPEEKRPTKILNTILMETLTTYKDKQAELKAASAKDQEKLNEEAAQIQSLLFSLLSAMGRPISIQGQARMISVTHDQLPIILKELNRRHVEAAVSEALVRSFPLGESLWRMGIPALWKKGLTGKGIKVAVIDNGIDPEHPDLASAVSKVVNFTRDRGDHAKGGHATPMADIIHAIAPEAEILSYQALSNTNLPGVTLDGEETNQAVLNSLEAAAKDGAQIINLSLGAAGGYSSDEISRKVDELSKQGVIIVVSAGNSGLNLPAGFQVGTPGTSESAISVGAMDYHHAPADFSSHGLVFNPQKQTVEEKPDIFAFGVNVKAATQLPEEFYAAEPAPYDYVSGTSPAAPHVSGAAALMIQAAQKAGIAASGSLIPFAAKTAMIQSAKRFGNIKALENVSAAIKSFIKLLS